MLFNSLHFLVFFLIVMFVYYLIPHRHRWVLLLSASYYFYMSWMWEYIILIIISTGIDFYAGKKISKAKTKRRKYRYLIFSLSGNLGILFFYKYFNFFNESLSQILGFVKLNYTPDKLDLILPMGISFYTFQTLSYTIDIYRGRIRKYESHLGIFALYVAFFPQLVAGPIERARNLLPQLHKKVKVNYDQIISGFRLILWGFLKKILIADNVARYVDLVFSNPRHQRVDPEGIILAAFLFALQVYCDFSAYTDIARGSARALGIKIMKNFDQPFLAHTMADFWRRWHISMSSWFKEYLYISLGGNRVSIPKWVIIVIFTFTVIGLWHGARWTFVLWGAYSGLYIVIEAGLQRPLSRLLKKFKISSKSWFLTPLYITLTYLAFSFGLLSFRANSYQDLISIFQKLGHLNLNGFATSIWQVALIYAAIYVLTKLEDIQKVFKGRRISIRWFYYVTASLAVLLFGNLGEKPFVYFQF